MKSLAYMLGILVIIAAVVIGPVWWRVYRYNDCRRVGHSRLYCVLDNGN